MIQQIHGGVGRNVVEDITNIELKPTFVSLVDDDAMRDDAESCLGVIEEVDY